MEPPIAPEMVAAIARPEHTVRIVFADGEVRDPALFEQVKIDEQTGTIVCPGMWTWIQTWFTRRSISGRTRRASPFSPQASLPEAPRTAVDRAEGASRRSVWPRRTCRGLRDVRSSPLTPSNGGQLDRAPPKGLEVLRCATQWMYRFVSCGTTQAG